MKFQQVKAKVITFNSLELPYIAEKEIPLSFGQRVFQLHVDVLIVTEFPSSSQITQMNATTDVLVAKILFCKQTSLRLLHCYTTLIVKRKYYIHA